MKRIIIFIFLLLCGFVCNAKQYKLVALHGVTIDCAGRQLCVDDLYNSETDELTVTWNDKSGYYLLKDMAEGTTMLMRPNTIPNDESGLKFTDWLKHLLTNVKNCSSRAPEDELGGGLEDYLSQTFYLSTHNELLSKIQVASDLTQDEFNFFSISIIEPRATVELKLPAQDDFTLTLEDVKAVSNIEEGMVLRCCVVYSSVLYGRKTITNTMNLVILP